MGRPAYGGRPTCEGCVSIDMRHWHREGRLHAGQHFPCSWTYAGRPFGSISVRTEADAVVLVFHSRNSQGSDWKFVEQRVPITWTGCHFGGRRAWFRCTVYFNARYCGRRVALLYGAGYSCRRCYGVGLCKPADKPCTAAFIGRKRSGCGSAEARTYVSRSRKNQSGCTGDVFIFSSLRSWPMGRTGNYRR